MTTTAPIDPGTLRRSTSRRPGPFGCSPNLADGLARRHLEGDAFDLCVAAHALGFVPTVTEPLVQRTFRAMRAAIVNRVASMTEFEAAVEEYSAALLLAAPGDRERFREHHRGNLVNFGISGQTVEDTALGDMHILIVGPHALLSAQVFVERHERGHVGLHALGVPSNRQEGILQLVGLGADRVPHLGIRVRA